MKIVPRVRTAATSIAITVLSLTYASTAAATPHAAATPASLHQSVDEAQLVPLLSRSFAPWTCRNKRGGAVCTGERHLRIAPEITDLPCSQPLWDRYNEDRYQTRYYGPDHLNYFRTFRTDNVDYFGTSADDPTPAVYRTKVRFSETFAVPGDDQTLTITSHGLLWDLRTGSGAEVLHVVGTLVEPYNGPATLTGTVTVNGVSTRYVDELWDDVLHGEEPALICQAALSES